MSREQRNYNTLIEQRCLFKN